MKNFLKTCLIVSILLFSSCGGTKVDVGTTYTNDSIGLSFSFPNGYEIVDEQIDNALVVQVQNTENTETELTNIILSANAQVPLTVENVEYKFNVEVVDGYLEIVDFEQREQTATLEEAYTTFTDSNGILCFLFVTTNLPEEDMLAIFKGVVATVQIQ